MNSSDVDEVEELSKLQFTADTDGLYPLCFRMGSSCEIKK